MAAAPGNFAEWADCPFLSSVPEEVSVRRGEHLGREVIVFYKPSGGVSGVPDQWSACLASVWSDDKLELLLERIGSKVVEPSAPPVSEAPQASAGMEGPLSPSETVGS